MQLTFEMGDSSRPRGHALVYFRGPDDGVLATYVVVPPIPIELGKFLPALLTAQMPALGMPQNMVMPLPPLLETMESVAELERLARLRDDDLVNAGLLPVTTPDRLLQAAAEVAQEYAELYASYAEGAAPIEVEASPTLPELDTDDIFLQLMSDRDKLSELSKRTGQLRYALEGGDSAAIGEAIQGMERVGRYLAPKYRCVELIAVARTPGTRSQRLADLYLQRAYKVAAEEFDALAALDAAIEAAAADSGENPKGS